MSKAGSAGTTLEMVKTRTLIPSSTGSRLKTRLAAYVVTSRTPWETLRRRAVSTSPGRRERASEHRCRIKRHDGDECVRVEAADPGAQCVEGAAVSHGQRGHLVVEDLRSAVVVVEAVRLGGGAPAQVEQLLELLVLPTVLGQGGGPREHRVEEPVRV